MSNIFCKIGLIVLGIICSIEIIIGLPVLIKAINFIGNLPLD